MEMQAMSSVTLPGTTCETDFQNEKHSGFVKNGETAIAGTVMFLDTASAQAASGKPILTYATTSTVCAGVILRCNTLCESADQLKALWSDGANISYLKKGNIVLKVKGAYAGLKIGDSIKINATTGEADTAGELLPAINGTIKLQYLGDNGELYALVDIK